MRFGVAGEKGCPGIHNHRSGRGKKALSLTVPIGYNSRPARYFMSITTILIYYSQLTDKEIEASRGSVIAQSLWSLHIAGLPQAGAKAKAFNHYNILALKI